MRVAIIGGGITGLVAGYELARSTDFEIDIYEASSRLGGKISTSNLGDFLVEQGPDCFFTRKPGGMELVRELGLEGELIDPLRSEFAMLVEGRLYAVPRRLAALGNVDPECVERADFLSESAKEAFRSASHQLACGPGPSVPDPKVYDQDSATASGVKVLGGLPPGVAGVTPWLSAAIPPGSGKTASDVSIRSFFTQNYGSEFSRLVAEPLLAGTHGGDPDKLSMRALYPGYLGGPTPPATGSGATFRSFKGGMETLIDALQKAIEGRVRVHLNSSIQSLGEIEADQFAIAVPAPVAAGLLPTVSGLLSKITHRSTSIVTFAFPRTAIRSELPYTGFLAPEGEHPFLTGSTWSSEKWEGRSGTDILIRVFVKEGTTAEQALEAIRAIMGIEGEPIFHQTTNWINAQPQYELGHLDLVEEIETEVAKLGNVVLAGTSYRGVGIPDCIRQGREAARVVIEAIDS